MLTKGCGRVMVKGHTFCHLKCKRNLLTVKADESHMINIKWNLSRQKKTHGSIYLSSFLFFFSFLILIFLRCVGDENVVSFKTLPCNAVKWHPLVFHNQEDPDQKSLGKIFTSKYCLIWEILRHQILSEISLVPLEFLNLLFAIHNAAKAWRLFIRMPTK